MNVELSEEQRLVERTRETHAQMQAGYLLGFREDHPTRCQLPAFRTKG